MSILYHLSKANVVADALSIMSMCSTSHIEECIKELAKESITVKSTNNGFQSMRSGGKMGLSHN